MAIDWCEELEKLEAEEATSSCPMPFMPLVPQESFADKALKVILTTLLNQGNPRFRGNGSKPKGRYASLRSRGQCKFYPDNCSPMRDGQGCRRNTRLTAHCPLRNFFARRRDGTISTRLRNDARLMLLYNLRRNIGYG